MAVRTITVTEEAYQRLARLKQPGESFSQLLKRLIPETTWRDLVGLLSPKAAEELRRNVHEGRKKMDAEFRKRQERIRRALQGEEDED